VTLRRAVLDASAAVSIVLDRPVAEGLAEFLDDCPRIWAPELLIAEAANALGKYVRTRELTVASALERLQAARVLVDAFIPTVDLVEEAFFVSSRNRHPIYDLLYAVLARRRGAVLLTLDRRQATVAQEMGIDVMFPG
jgi:predicted nucleic acid-binding protein